jgi:hypothetical protein
VAQVRAAESDGERLCRTLDPHVRAEVTDRMLVAGPRHLHAVREGTSCTTNSIVHSARKLRAPAHDDITMAAIFDMTTARIRRQRVLGGLISCDCWGVTREGSLSGSASVF